MPGGWFWTDLGPWDRRPGRCSAPAAELWWCFCVLMALVLFRGCRPPFRPSRSWPGVVAGSLRVAPSMGGRTAFVAGQERLPAVVRAMGTLVVRVVGSGVGEDNCISSLASFWKLLLWGLRRVATAGFEGRAKAWTVTPADAASSLKASSSLLFHSLAGADACRCAPPTIANEFGNSSA